MRSCIRSLISTLCIFLVLFASAAYFKNTEAFLNGRHHFDQSRHHDYDQNGKKESTHHKHGSPVMMVKLTFVSQVSRLIVLESSFVWEPSPFEHVSMSLEDFKITIFRPPIFA